MLTENEKYHLEKLLKENPVNDNSSFIQEFQISHKIKQDIATYQQLYKKKKGNNDMDAGFLLLVQQKCKFTFEAYPDIFKKIISNDKAEMAMLATLLQSLELIEKKKKNQHEASAIVGKMLKTQFVDANISSSSPYPSPSLTWKEYNERNS